MSLFRSESFVHMGSSNRLNIKNALIKTKQGDISNTCRNHGMRISTSDDPCRTLHRRSKMGSSCPSDPYRSIVVNTSVNDRDLVKRASFSE